MDVAWIGLGAMGLPMASNLAAAGHHVVGFDLSGEALAAARSAGIDTADTARAAARNADVIFTMLPKGDHVFAALFEEDGALNGAPASAIVVDSSTISVQQARDIAERVLSTGRRFLDAPVSGGTAGAQAGQLTFMVGGAADDLAAVEPLLELMGAKTFLAGPAGNGQAAKTVNNMILGINLAGACQGVVLAQRLGLDQKVFRDIAMASSGGSWVLQNYHPIRGVAQNAPSDNGYRPGFAAELLLKDISLALEAASATQTPATLAGEVAGQLRELIAAGHGRADCSALVTLADGSISEQLASLSPTPILASGNLESEQGTA